MFSINIYLRFALMAILILGGIILSIAVNFWYGLPLLLVGLVLAVGYVMFGTVQSAAMMMQDGDFDATEQRLGLTLKPEWLFGPSKAMYFLTKGTIAVNRKDMDGAETWFKKAEEIKMPTDNETAMVQIQLAALNASRRRWNHAKAHVKKAKDLNITNNEMKMQLVQIEQMVKTKGQSHAVRQRVKGKRGQRYFN
ncbi:MAG: tetratricopeptide repeat protein [Saprospiraceae bacterium]